MVLPVVLWWLELALIGALTLFILAEAYRIVQYARTIKYLAERTLPAARSIAAHTAAVSTLTGLSDPAERLARTAHALDNASAALSSRLARQSPGRLP